jgi:glycosyltransferase involved in cell wall biosynthesis
MNQVSSPIPSGGVCTASPGGQSVLRPSLSFIIPVYNDQANIGRCVRSITALQKFRQADDEVIILDNGSTDETHQILNQSGFPFEVIEHLHVSALRNRGAWMAKGDLLAFVDSDVELFPEWLENSLDVFEDPLVVAAGCFPEVPTDATWVQRSWDVQQRGCQPTTSFSIAWLPSMNLIVRREAFESTGGFNEDLETAEDVDLCYRLANHGTIMCNPTMKAIHWGEAKDLATFWKKEVWRGIGNVRGMYSHGFRLDELPSVGYPLYILLFATLFGVGVGVDLWNGQVLISLPSLALLVLPAIMLAIKAAHRSQRLSSVPALFVLYLTYGFARALAILKSFFPRSKSR